MLQALRLTRNLHPPSLLLLLLLQILDHLVLLAELVEEVFADSGDVLDLLDALDAVMDVPVGLQDEGRLWPHRWQLLNSHK